MKSYPIALLAAGIAFWWLLIAGSHLLLCQSEVRFHFISDSSIILVPVLINGQGPFPFILDTGADDVILDASLARRLALPVSGNVHQATILGAWVSDRSLADSLQLGPVQIQNAPVLLTDLSGIRSRVPEAYGILGQRFLSHFNYLIDYQDRFIHFEQNDEVHSSVRGKRLPSAIVGNRLLLLAHARRRAALSSDFFWTQARTRSCSAAPLRMPFIWSYRARNLKRPLVARSRFPSDGLGNLLWDPSFY